MRDIIAGFVLFAAMLVFLIAWGSGCAPEPRTPEDMERANQRKREQSHQGPGYRSTFPWKGERAKQTLPDWDLRGDGKSGPP